MTQSARVRTGVSRTTLEPARTPFRRGLAALLFVIIAATGAAPALAQDGAASIPVKLLDGRNLTLGDYRGKVVVLSFWTVDCTNCKAEMPHIDRMYETYRTKGLEVIGVNLDPPRNASRVKPTVRRYGYSFPVALDPEGELAAPFDPSRATPFTVVLDRAGKTRYSHLGYRAGDEVELEKVIQKLLATPAAGHADKATSPPGERGAAPPANPESSGPGGADVKPGTGSAESGDEPATGSLEEGRSDTTEQP